VVTDDQSAEHRGFEVTVFVPEAAPKYVCEIVFDAVEEAMESLETKNPLIAARESWDLSIDGSPADHRAEAALDRKVKECITLKAEIERLTVNVNLMELQRDYERQRRKDVVEEYQKAGKSWDANRKRLTAEIELARTNITRLAADLLAQEESQVVDVPARHIHHRPRGAGL
jgi:hypothetical protein